jgi:CRP/FNR family transcriptional regulator
MSNRLRRAQQNVRDLALKDSSARVAGLLIFLAEKYGKKRKDKVILDISLTQQELASMIGSSRETVSRVLGQFESEDLIKTSRKKIIIYKKDKIKAYT